jgi:diaminopimelate epimerase
MQLDFVKMHGLGNDFLLIDALQTPVALLPEEIARLADRRRGVGFDQLLLIEPAGDLRADVRYRIFNPDGAEVGQCGNGIRCVARYLRDQGFGTDEPLVVESRDRLIEVFHLADGRLKVDMGAPRLAPADLPMRAVPQAMRYRIDAAGEQWSIAAISMGNPHAVLEVANVDTAPVATLGPLLERHRDFPEGVNVGFMQIVARDRIRLRVHERGAGETLACGTGACAAVVAGRLDGRLDARVEVALPGGLLGIEWEGGGAPVWMTGPAEYAFRGTTTS